MAKKKLNKKVAIAGSIVLVLFALAAIWYVLYKMQGPKKFIEDGDAAVAVKDYESAVKQYGRGLSRAKDNDTRKKILFKLADIHVLNSDWRKAMACWNKIQTIDTSDKTSRIELLNFYYAMADSGQYGVWKTVLTTVDELLPLAPEAKYYLIKGRAKLELAKGGEVVDKVQALNEAIEILQKAQKLDASNPTTYQYLAAAVSAKGEALASKGAADEIKKAQNQAQKLLEKAVAVAPKDPNSYIQLLNIKLLAAQDKKQFDALEPDFVALAKKFPDSANVFSSLSFYYLSTQQDQTAIDKALKAAVKAMQLDPTAAKYALAAADICYRKGSLAKDNAYLQKATEIAEKALTLPDAQDTKGAREYANKINKLSLNTFLAQRYIEQLLDLPAGASKQQKDALAGKAEQAVHEVAQIWGSGEHPYVIEMEGMLAYAKGDTAEGVRKMYTAYQQLKQSDAKNQDVQLAQLSYMLARVFANSSEIGATREFLFNALQRRVHLVKPDALLLYAQISMPLRQYSEVISALDTYEKIVPPTSESHLLRARATIAAGQLDDAQTMLAKMKADDPNVMGTKIMLLQTRIEQAAAANRDANAVQKENGAIQAEIDKYRDEQTKLAAKLLQPEPNATQALSMVCENLIAKNKIQEAKAVVGAVLARVPDNTIAAFYKLLLAEPNPAKIEQKRRMELSEQAISAIADPKKRALALAENYRAKETFDKAIAEYKKALELDPANKTAIGGVFDTALQAKDLSLAEQFASIAKRENIDLCGGEIFMARLAMAKKEYKDAVSRLDVAIKDRPLFSVAYTLRSSAQAELGNEQLAVEDARKASELNPLDVMAAKNLANLLYQRNFKLGTKASGEQITEARDAIRRAWQLNPREWQLLSFYAEYIKDTDPRQALSIRQQLQTSVPTVQNAALLGNLAAKLASQQTDTTQQKAYLDIAKAAYEQGYKIDPNDPGLLRSYAEFYSMTGNPRQAEQLLKNAPNKNLLWVHQLRVGQYEQARETLDVLYKEDPKNIDILKGQMLVAQNLGDAKGVTRYSQELISFENTPENHLAQIEAFLQVGLVELAQKQLASYMEKHPDDKRTTMLQAWLAIKKGEFTEALTFINKNLELKPDDAVSWNLRGQIHLARGNYDEAVNDFRKAKAASPTLQTRTALARAYIRAARGNDAINELVNAADEFPGNTDLSLMLEETYMQLGKTDSLSRFYTDMIKKYPEAPFWYNRAAAFEASQKNFDKASALYKAAFELGQKADQKLNKEAMLQQSAVAFEGYLNVMFAKKQYDQLITHASQYIDSAMAPIAFAKMADAKAELGDKTAAAEYYRKSLQKAASDNTLVMNILRKMSAAVGTQETIKWCSEQLKTSPDSLTINLAMCNLQQMNNENVKALPYIEKCMQIVGPKNSQYQNFIDTKQAILIKLYTATSDEKYLNSAIKLYEDYIAGSSSVEAGALNNLAYLLASNDRDIDKAVNYIKTAYDVVQNNPNILDTYAYVLYKKGDYKKALELIQSAAQMFEKSSVSAPAEVYEHSGMINAKLGRKTEAANAYKQALKIGEKTLSDEQKKRITAAIEALK